MTRAVVRLPQCPTARTRCDARKNRGYAAKCLPDNAVTAALRRRYLEERFLPYVATSRRTQLGEGFMESVVGFLAVAGGFGVALGLTMLGMNAVLSIMPTRRR